MPRPPIGSGQRVLSMCPDHLTCRRASATAPGSGRVILHGPQHWPKSTRDRGSDLITSAHAVSEVWIQGIAVSGAPRYRREVGTDICFRYPHRQSSRRVAAAITPAPRRVLRLRPTHAAGGRPGRGAERRCISACAGATASFDSPAALVAFRSTTGPRRAVPTSRSTGRRRPAAHAPRRLRARLPGANTARLRSASSSRRSVPSLPVPRAISRQLSHPPLRPVAR